MAKVRAKRAAYRTKAGTQITPEIAESLADEAERGYNPGELKPRPVGRPSLSGTGPSARVSFRADPELYAAARERAAREGRTVSEIARDALRGYLWRDGWARSTSEARDRADRMGVGPKDVEQLVDELKDAG